MSVLLYAIAADGPSGLEDVGLRPIRAAGLMALVGAGDGRPRGAAALLEHERVLERLLEHHPLVPARFGTLLSDDREALALLHSRREQLHAALELVRGAVELAVRARWVAASTPVAASGTAYMLGLLERERRTLHLAEALAPLTALGRADRPSAWRHPGEPFVRAYLVDRGRIGAFAQTVGALDAELRDVELTCTGPWPPYSFADLQADSQVAG